MQQDRQSAVLHRQGDQRDERVRHLQAAQVERRRAARAGSAGRHCDADSTALDGVFTTVDAA